MCTVNLTMKFFVFLVASYLSARNSYSSMVTEDEKVENSTGITENEITDENISDSSIDYAHSPIDLLDLTVVEESLFALVNKYIFKSDKEQDSFFKRYIADYEASTLVAFNGWNETLVKKKHFLIHSNPLLSHRMLWRFVTDFPEIKNVLLSLEDSEILEQYESALGPHFVWPSKEDLNNSMESLLHLHDIYDLNIIEFSNGIIANVVTNSSLSAIHCFEISKHAFYLGKYTLALEWLDIADLKRSDVNSHPILDYLEENDVMELLDDIIEKHDAEWTDNEDPGYFNIYQYVNKIKSKYRLLTKKKVIRKHFTGKGWGSSSPTVMDITAFPKLCQGENLQSEKEKSELYCWYESKINPAWYINPQKMELFSKDPYIFQVYDFIGDNFITFLKKSAVPILERSTVSHFKDSDEEEKKTPYHNSRTSMYSWLSEDEYLPVLLLSQRIGYLTELITSWKPHTNDLQVAVYATGGYFNVHIDSLYNTDDFHVLIEDNIGDRTATFMLYLNDVELGGNTAFTSAGVAVPPVKGSAVFWYDSKRNGEVDYKAWHGGCPVLLGEKWVANKWIHSDPNMFKRKCTLDKNE